MPDAAPSPETFFKAFGLLSHLYLTPVLGALIEGRVPDHLDAGALPASELAKRTGLDALTVTRSLRALAAFGAFQEVSPGVFANTPVSEFSATGRAGSETPHSSGVVSTSWSPQLNSGTA
jgi:hypothetical protein